jgi:hypothetical protein
MVLSIIFLEDKHKIFIFRKNWWNALIWVTGHCNREAVSRNRYSVEKTVDTHKILIDAIKFLSFIRNNFFIFLFKLSKHNIYLTVKFTNKIQFEIKTQDRTLSKNINPGLVFY